MHSFRNSIYPSENDLAWGRREKEKQGGSGNLITQKSSCETRDDTIPAFSDGTCTHFLSLAVMWVCSRISRLVRMAIQRWIESKRRRDKVFGDHTGVGTSARLIATHLQVRDNSLAERAVARKVYKPHARPNVWLGFEATRIRGR